MSGTPEPPFSLFRPEKRITALGLAINHIMAKPAFMRLHFGEWSQIMAGLINRDHYFFVVDESHHIQGFAGWALTRRNSAENWLAGHRGLSFKDCLDGDCVVMNVWSADTTAVHRFMVRETRKLLGAKQALYFRRYYKNGKTRSVRINNDPLLHRLETGLDRSILPHIDS